ncbi:Uncharacterized protein HZ326_19011 [Fusarium oxysporum f. sp. albedinis]|nr:Uncharacterized protein HZ326_19011 [Fusarium oxysporum f. sp. albedinis]
MAPLMLFLLQRTEPFANQGTVKVADFQADEKFSAQGGVSVPVPVLTLLGKGKIGTSLKKLDPVRNYTSLSKLFTLLGKLVRSGKDGCQELGMRIKAISEPLTSIYRFKYAPEVSITIRTPFLNSLMQC